MESKNETQLKPKKKNPQRLGSLSSNRVKVQSGVGKVTISPPPDSKSP